MKAAKLPPSGATRLPAAATRDGRPKWVLTTPSCKAPSAALAGDAFGAEPWLDLFEPEAPVSGMLAPSHASGPLVVPAVPAVLIWRDGVLIDILVGDGRSSELARYLEVLET